MLRQLYHIAVRECGIMWKNPIYGFCMVIFPIVIIIFFTSLMHEGVPADMPVGVVDCDNTSTTRTLIHKLDAFQTTKVVAHFENVNEAREAIQRNEIYAFLYLPKGTTRGLMNGSQPKISFYYSNVALAAGSMLFRDLKTISTLGSASVSMKKLSAVGKTTDEIKTYLQPIDIDLHMIGNPWASYNIYLSTIMIPGVLLLFVFLITPYSLGTELKFKRSRELMTIASNRTWIAVVGKLIPQFLIFASVFFGFELYIYHHLGFPHPGGFIPIFILGLLSVLSAQAFGVFVFGLMPSLRMSMSVCSLWAMIGFSTCGATYPLFAMDSMIEAGAQLFPLRHYYMIYQICILNDFPATDAWFNFMALAIFIALPVFVIHNIKKAMLLYVYIP